MSDRGANATELAPESGHLPVRAGASVAVALILVTAGSLYYFYSRGLTNLYGDGLAHVEGARRLFDSRTPGYAEIGSTWLPLFQILASPLAQNAFLWKTGMRFEREEKRGFEKAGATCCLFQILASPLAQNAFLFSKGM